MFWIWILYCFIVVLAKKKSLNEIPIVQTASKNYYLELRIGGEDSPRTLFYLDFNSTTSYLDGSLFPHLEVKKNHTLQVIASKNNKLGSMKFNVLQTNISWIEYKGIIGLGKNNDFILMLQKTFNKQIGLRVELISGSMVIQGHPCRNPQVGPFKVSLTTWTTINYRTPLSFNFQPTSDFLALLNKTQNDFHMDVENYHEDRIQIQCLNQQRKIKLKRFIDCWNVDSSDTYECKVNTSSTPDVGLAIFSLPVKICKNGVDIGVSIIPTQSYFTYFAILIGTNFLFAIIFLKREKIISCLTSKNAQIESTQQIAQE